MSIITMPQGLYVSSLTWKQHRFEMTETSEPTGSGSVRVYGPPKWGMTVGCDGNATPDQADIWRTMVLGLDGRVNRLAAYDSGRTVPRGTMRGTLTLASGIAAYATSLTLAGASGTLRAGDWLQIGSGIGTSMLINVMADVLASGGTATVTFKAASRYAFAGGVTVTWDHPVGYYAAMNKDAGWTYEPNSQVLGNFSLDLIEAFT